MNYVILDLEWNAAYSRKLKGYINEIIEFGAVKCDEQLNIIDTFSSFVKLQVGKKISSIVSELTTIKDENLSDAQQFMQVVSKFKRWAGNCVILTWGTSDILTLIENCRYFSGSGQIPFLTSYVDMQKYCEDCLGHNSNEQMGLNKAAELLEVDVSKIPHHRALGDSLISLEILRSVRRKGLEKNMLPYTEDALSDEFYKKMTFKTVIICDISNPLITKKSLGFVCEKCGGEAQRLTKWQVRNKKFYADFRCRNCGYAFSGRIQVKQKYDGVVVSKKSVPLPKIEKPRKAAPGPVGSMDLEIVKGVGLLRFPEFSGIKGLNHAFSTRIGGVSSGKFAAMNLGLNRGDDNSKVFENFRRIAAAYGEDKEMFVAGAQDHHTNIRRVTAENGGTGIYKPKDMESIDGLCTNEEGITLVVYAADCVPIYYYDSKNRAIGLAHAGWRGTAADMAGTMVRKMAEEFGTDPSELKVAIGPSIGPASFEVDKPCADEFAALESSDKFLRDDGNGKYHVDLWECNRQLLIKAGVKEENIVIGGVDTFTNSDLIFSHRVTKGERGSNAALMTLTPVVK